MTSLCDFMKQINEHTLGISLQYEASKNKIHFLDLNIEIRDMCLTPLLSSKVQIEIATLDRAVVITLYD